MNENKRYNPRSGAIHPEDTFTERNAVPDNSKELLRRRLLQKIDSIRSQKRLLIEEMNDCVDRGFLGKRKEILDKLIALDREEKELTVSIGLKVNVHTCLGCGEEEGERRMVFSAALGGWLCPVCKPKVELPEFGHVPPIPREPVVKPVSPQNTNDVLGKQPESVPKKPEPHREEEKMPEPESVKPNENHICQYCFKKVSQVYKCTKCSLELCSKHVSNHSCVKESYPESESPLPPVWVEPQDTPIKSLNWSAIIIIFFGIILSSFIISSFLANSSSQNPVTPSNFNNNTTEKVTNPLPTPKDSFDKINEYREQNKKYKILWSDDAYRLADFRASDMVKRSYFSHTTPDGKTVSDYIGKYNFYSNSAWGENLCKGCSDPIQTWIGSADDREVLLGGWGKGAVACESDICVFIGVKE